MEGKYVIFELETEIRLWRLCSSASCDLHSYTTRSSSPRERENGRSSRLGVNIALFTGGVPFDVTVLALGSGGSSQSTLKRPPPQQSRLRKSPLPRLLRPQAIPFALSLLRTPRLLRPRRLCPLLRRRNFLP